MQSTFKVFAFLQLCYKRLTYVERNYGMAPKKISGQALPAMGAAGVRTDHFTTPHGIAPDPFIVTMHFD
jgi:hypothetical protein